jgi:hypothetical protein
VAAREALGLAKATLGDFEKRARLLAKLKLSHDDALRVILPIYQDDVEVEDAVKNEAVRSRRVKAIMEAYQSAPGAVPGTAWGVLNGVTYWADHVAGRDADQRLTSSWTGTESRRKQRVLDDLVALTA